MVDGQPFGPRVRERRRTLDLTQEELARRVGCASVTLRKIEGGHLRASRQIAERLAVALGIPLEEREAFVRAARSAPVERGEGREPSPSRTPLLSPEEVGSDDLSGRAIRSYQLGERIGAGGFGAVYRAVQPSIEREVAIKLILPRFADHPDFIRRFEGEARLVARLEHPHIVPLYDYWRDPGFAFLVMRYLRGGSLNAQLSAGPLPPERVLQLAEQLGAALHVAHRAGVVHRDLKPSNILLDEEGNAFLADFGIAKDLALPAPEHTVAGAFVGSPAYSSPEQLRAEPVTPQADIYAFGVLLYELLTGQRPFHGPTPAALIQQQLTSSLPRLAEARPGLGEHLDHILQRATAKLPGARYPDVTALLAELRDALADRPAPALVRQNGAAPAAPPTLVLDLEDSDNPYQGLQAFDEADAEDYFGRETLVHQLLSRMGEGSELSRFLALIGPSGSGKSSLARAGLLPALRRGGLPGSESWYVLTLTPGARPLDELAGQLRSVAPLGVEADDLRALLGADERGLLRAARLVLPAEPQTELLLLIDQFEELFTLCEDRGERAHVLRSLVTAVLDERSRLRVVLTLRADFIDQALLDVDFGELLRQRGELVLPLTAEELERAIVGPAQRLGLALEDGLVATMIADVGAQPGALPLLQHALSELFRRRRGRVLIRGAYAELGGVSGALAVSAEGLYQQLSAEDQDAARQLLLRLVTPGLGVADTRRRAGRAELAEVLGVAAFDRVGSAFGKARLLTFDHDPASREATVEVAHETLLHAWPRLREWIGESREALLAERRLALAAAEWERSGRERSFLASGARLEQFAALAVSGQLALSGEEQAYLAASAALRDALQAEEEARRQRELAAARALAATEQRRADEQSRAAAQLRRRAVYLGGALAVALVAMLAAGLFGSQARVSAERNAALAGENAAIASTAQAARDRAEQEARTATSRELSLAAISNLNLDAERSVLLALQALSAADTPEAQNALHQAVMASRVRLTLSDDGGIYSVAFSPDGARLAMVAGEKIEIRDSADGKLLQTIPGTYAYVRFSPEGRRIVAADDEATALVFDSTTGSILQTLSGHAEDVWYATFSPDGRLVATGGVDATAKLWDAATGQLLATLSGHTDSVHKVAFSPDGRRLATASWDQTVRVWDIESGQEQMSLPLDNVGDVVFSPDGRQLATGSFDVATVWDSTTGEELLRVNHPSGYVSSTLFSPDGARLITASQAGTVKVWDLATGDELLTVGAHTNSVIDLAVHPDGRQIATAGEDGTAKVWDISPEGSREWLTLAAHRDEVRDAVFSPDGARIATGGDDNLARIWDAATGAELLTLNGHTDIVRGVAFSPDGRRLATSSRDLTLRVWDAMTGRSLMTLRQPGHGDGVIGATHRGIMDVKFSPDGRYLASAGADGTAVIWDASTGAVRHTLSNQGLGITSLVFSPDGRLATTGWDWNYGVDDKAYTRIWDVETGEELLAVATPGTSLWGVTFSPDGSQLVTGGYKGVLKAWKADTGQEVRTMPGHIGVVMGIAFSSDGLRLVTASNDGVAKLWDAASGEELLSLSGHSDGFKSLALSPDGTRLLTADSTGMARVYLLSIEELRALAVSRLTRTLTTEECRRYLHVEQCPAGP